jgi:tetratricopeptide (TPR) repeat protein
MVAWTRFESRGTMEPLNIRLRFFVFAVWVIIGDRGGLVVSASAQQTGTSRVLKENSDAQDVFLAAVEADISANKFDDTESRLNGYISDHPTSSRAYYDLGYVQFRTHQIGPSIEHISKSLELNPNNAEAHKVLGLNCSIIGRYDLAEVELQQAVRLKPESAENHYFLARTYYTRGVYPLAKSEFETAIRLDPSYIKAYSNLGITMEALGNNDDALRNYTTAIQLEDRQKQKSEWPYIYLSAFYNRQKNATEALRYARRATEVNAASDTAYFEMAKAFRTQKLLEKAVEATQKAIAINSRNSDYYYVLGLTLRELGKQQESAQALATYAQLQQHSEHAVPESQEPLVGPEPQ